MAVISDYGILKWNNANKKRYIELGYEFTKIGEEFKVKIEHLTKTTRAIVDVACDYCGDIKNMTYKEFNNKLSKSIVQKTTCSSKECRNKKNEESCLIKYGVEHQSKSEIVINNKKNAIKEKYGEEYDSVFQVPHVKEKIRETIEKVYGVSNIAFTEYAKNKTIETNLIKYGKEFYTQTSEYREKVLQTSIQKYGVPHFTQSEDVKGKVRQTNIHKFGFPYNLQSPEVRKQIESTNLEKYGVRYYTQTIDYKIKYCGENSHNWNPNKTAEERLIERKYPEYYDWRKKVFERDNYTCQCCDISGSKITLNAHHLNSYHWDIEGRTDLNNGITLCINCHNDFHNKYGRHYNTKEQYVEFMTKYKMYDHLID